MTRIRFAILNLVLFALFLPIYLSDVGKAGPVVIRPILVILVGTTGWFGVIFLILGVSERFGIRRRQPHH